MTDDSAASGRPPLRATFRLIARVGGREIRCAVDTRAIVAGSAADCDYVLPDPTVSRRHARLRAVDAGVRVEDLGSRNGTRVDAARVAQAVVPPGVRLQLGEVELRVEPLAAHDVGAALGADVACDAAPHPASAPEPTLVSAGLTRFCVRELEPLLLRLAQGVDTDAFAAPVLRALASASPDAGFRLLRAGTGALLAQSGEGGRACTSLVRDAFVLDITAASDDALPALRTLGSMALALLAAARRERMDVVTPETETSSVEPPPTSNAALRELYWQAARVARSRLNVLVTGETGTGKELLARYLHDASGEPDDRFLVLNCAALPGDLLDAELFGIEAGVATGVAARAGRFELAHGGTLFLDEIGDMSLDTQARILRVLQEREVYRVGSHRPRPADVRIVSATHRDLEAMVREGRFRLDLYHRIADWRAALPPLRERREDIANLAAGFLARGLAPRGLRSGGLSQGAVDALQRYGWPGNVRELEREMQRVALFVDGGETVISTMLKPEIACSAAAPAEQADTLSVQLECAEREIVARALDACGGSATQAAERLGVSRATLYRRLAQLGIDRGS